MTAFEQAVREPGAGRPVKKERRALDRLMALIQALGPPDRQVALLYLEDLDAAAIGEVTGLSPGAVAVRIHRLKALLARRFAEGGAA